MTDREILDLFRSEKTRDKAFTGLVQVYSKKLYWHIRRMVTDHDDANDVVQNAMIKIWKGLPAFKEDSALYTWLYRIATNEAITFLNSNKKRAHINSQVEAESSSGSLKAEAWLDSETVTKKLQQAIEALPDKQKQVFILRYYDEMKYEEMEAVLGTSSGALKASYHHAVKKIMLFMGIG